MIYRFVGLVSEINGEKLNRVGQKIECDPDEHGLPVITEEQFASIFTDQAELDRYGHVAARGAAPQSFIEKLRQAWALVVLPPEHRPAPQPAPEQTTTEPSVNQEAA